MRMRWYDLGVAAYHRAPVEALARLVRDKDVGVRTVARTHRNLPDAIKAIYILSR